MRETSKPPPGTAAKLVAPRTAQILRRPRILKQIDRSLRAGACWLAAPAGYGKTTALVDYLEHSGAPNVWFRIDEGDQDIARFFQYLAQSLGRPEAIAGMPVFGVEYAEQPREFARRFFRAYFTQLKPATILVLDDLHYADTADFRALLAVMLSELPPVLRCALLSRTLPREELGDLALRGQLTVIDQSALEFSEPEARSLVKLRLKRTAAAIDVGLARGWAVGLVLLAERGYAQPLSDQSGTDDKRALFDVLGRNLFYTLPADDQDTLLKLNLLPEINSDLANAMIGSKQAGELLDRLYQRQLLTTRSETGGHYFQLHDLLRDFLDAQLGLRFSSEELASLRRKTATLLAEAGRLDDAIELALEAKAWPYARELLLQRAGPVLAQGKRATFIDWCAKLPTEEIDAWLYYWLGVAHVPDDAAAERWLSQAWNGFEASGDRQGQALTVARAVLVKTDSWRTYEGLSTWTKRAMQLLEQGLPELPAEEDLLMRIGMMRALDFGDEYYRNSPAGQLLERQLLERLSHPHPDDTSSLRLLASTSLMEHSGTTMRADLFTKAVDSVIDDFGNPDALPWVLGMWLVAFGAKSGRYFSYARRGFPYASAEEALRAAIAIGERESLRGVEFGGLYHLQMQMKFRNDFAEFGEIVTRLAAIADSRFTTQVAVVADCHAALHARQRNFPQAYRDCERFMAAIEAANEPMAERWPHYVTQYQVSLSDRKPKEAIALIADLLPRLDDSPRRRAEIFILAATACEAKWQGDPRYADHLRGFLSELRGADWPMILLNLPELLAELLADALDHGIEIDYARSLIQRRHLNPPDRLSPRWPWPLKIRVLGDFELELDGVPLDLGVKPPTRALDILRALAVSKDHSVSVAKLQDWLWPDLDGDQAKAAYEQALHRLRKLLGQADFIIQRAGKLRLAADKVWVDLGAWETRLKQAQVAKTDSEKLESVLLDFPGPLLPHDRLASWLLPVAERLRSQFIDLTLRIGQQRLAQGDHEGARGLYLRALEFYPESAGIAKALIEAHLAQGDATAAMAEYARYERVARALPDGEPSPAIQALIHPHLDSASRSRRVSDP
ncbi:BTAD domain-containing putative transcriptional regulator [Taklimakanibacter lacteus]|uniref:BTAD domain-containing putative transcriptional regulator n=1 Tax=Taklimakanibacter lacteus TaxID=2268456 RepID=UPI0013C4720B